jgi:hypothetical protein
MMMMTMMREMMIKNAYGSTRIAQLLAGEGARARSQRAAGSRGDNACSTMRATMSQ